ncbi:hypothetical protein N2152v2_010137 [Parachlorella kessleri]
MEAAAGVEAEQGGMKVRWLQVAIFLSRSAYNLASREPVTAVDDGSAPPGLGGGGGNGSGEPSWEDDEGEYEALSTGAAPSGSSNDLAGVLRRIDGKGYKAYKDIQVPAQVARFPPDLLSTKVRRVAVCDFLTRAFGAVVAASGSTSGDVRRQSQGWGGEKGGEMTVDQPGQHVLERTSVTILQGGGVEARFTVALPAKGRTVLGQWALNILVQNLPRYVHTGLLYAQQDAEALRRQVACVEDTEALRAALPGLGLVAFVGDGSILPRKSGASDEPMASTEAVPFRSPDSLAVTVSLPNRGAVRGMGVRRGVTLIVGGGFHGKTTLLKAIEAGVYNKVPGDGRELIAADPGGVKIRAEDGRRVAAVDISPFITNLPYSKDTRCFSTPDASGSTSQAVKIQEVLEVGAMLYFPTYASKFKKIPLQAANIQEVLEVGAMLYFPTYASKFKKIPLQAANIQEALEVGATTLLIDEDTSATNFMIRDARMQELVSRDKEPITPFISKIRALAGRGVSCVLVIGGSGEYFDVAGESVDVADTVVCMDSYLPKDVTHEAQAIAKRFAGLTGSVAHDQDYGPVTPRLLLSVHPAQSGYGGRDLRVKTRTRHTIQLDQEELDLSAVEQLVEVSQTRAVADALLAAKRLLGGAWRGGRELRQVLDQLEEDMDREGVDALAGRSKPGNLARPRRFELAAAFNRLRTAQLRQLPLP